MYLKFFHMLVSFSSLSDSLLSGTQPLPLETEHRRTVYSMCVFCYRFEEKVDSSVFELSYQ